MQKAEADLEARVHKALTLAFPWIADDLEHQTHFSVRLGHSTVRVDGRSAETLSGRADILISHNKKPLAILELKREDIKLTNDDIQQGLSYAKLTNPMTPLVIVSNGKELRIYDTYSGNEWVPKERSAYELQQLLESSMKIATSNLRDAIQTLMNSNQQHWVSAFRDVTAQLILDRTGNWHDLMAPYVHDFLIPRIVTENTLNAINDNERVIVIHGPPLCGKSNVLRELCNKAREKENLAVLMLEPSDDGVFSALSNQLSSFLDWSLSAEDARDWLRRVSNREDATLVIALDGVDPTHTKAIADLNELAGHRFGSSLRLIVTVDDSVLEAVTQKPNGREQTVLGRVMYPIAIEPLCDIEFKQALRVLANNRILLTPGGESVTALREPWILRTLVPSYISELQSDQPSNKMVQLPPLLDIESLEQTGKACAVDISTQSNLRLAASAILDEYIESRSPAAIIHGPTTFAVSHHRLEEAIGEIGLQELRQRGLIKRGIDLAVKPVWHVRIPALVATYVAITLEEQMNEWGTPEEVAKQLVNLASRLPLGEVIVASAIVRYLTTESLKDPTALLSALLQQSPTTSSLTPGSKIIFSYQGKQFKATASPDGSKLILSNKNSTFEIDMEPELSNNNLIDYGGWLILSHVASMPIGIVLENEEEPERIDEVLLLEVAQSSVILSRPDGQQGFKEVITHDVDGHGSMVCHLAGVVEPITWSLMKYFMNRGSDADPWIDEAISKGSLPLLMRIHIALQQVSRISDERGVWAKNTLSSRVIPQFAKFPMHS